MNLLPLPLLVASICCCNSVLPLHAAEVDASEAPDHGSEGKKPTPPSSNPESSSAENVAAANGSAANPSAFDTAAASDGDATAPTTATESATTTPEEHSPPSSGMASETAAVGIPSAESGIATKSCCGGKKAKTGKGHESTNENMASETAAVGIPSAESGIATKSCCGGKKGMTGGGHESANENTARNAAGMSLSDNNIVSKSCCGGNMGMSNGGHQPASGNKSSCCGVMPMSFQASTHTVILFKSWETTEAVYFWLSCILWFFLGSGSVALKLLRLRIDHWSAGATAATVSAAKEQQQSTWRVATAPYTIRLLKTGLCTLVYAYDYLLMLVVMTFNVYLFFAVCLGLGFGVFCLGHKLRLKSEGEKQQLKEYRLDLACYDEPAQFECEHQDTLMYFGTATPEAVAAGGSNATAPVLSVPAVAAAAGPAADVKNAAIGEVKQLVHLLQQFLWRCLCSGGCCFNVLLQIQHQQERSLSADLLDIHWPAHLLQHYKALLLLLLSLHLLFFILRERLQPLQSPGTTPEGICCRAAAKAEMGSKEVIGSPTTTFGGVVAAATEEKTLLLPTPHVLRQRLFPSSGDFPPLLFVLVASRRLSANAPAMAKQMEDPP
ncbi:ctr copper transporter domain-containing protein [Cyclospora cayetanensis]|uniref:Ctr copper transporter domain-containing protein n=1 Tax=Cyclospora cayetanensis TaxID=88456 RepID=A0A1D3CVM0_9EIME|nr:ctr copper transporter domain-containing protein [Cyclospora cayetanensis]